MAESDDSVLPQFTYHPDPVGTGSIIPSNNECLACKRPRGWIYVGPTYCEAELDERLCPLCIADGAAHREFGVELVDPLAVGGYGDWDTPLKSVVDEVCFCTPAFNGWQPERWYSHCNDAAIFVGRAGKQELENGERAAYDFIRAESGYDEEEWGGISIKWIGTVAQLHTCFGAGIAEHGEGTPTATDLPQATHTLDQIPDEAILEAHRD